MNVQVVHVFGLYYQSVVTMRFSVNYSNFGTIENISSYIKPTTVTQSLIGTAVLKLHSVSSLPRY